jgi:two-component system response regulator MprA
LRTSTDSKVLIVDDDELTRIAFSGILSGAGYEVVEAIDGVHGLAMCEKENPALIILDVEMPKASGWQVLTTLRQRNWAKPILMLTGRTHIDDKVKGLGSGADDYLAKPCDSRELLARVNALLRRSQAVKSKVSSLNFGDTTINLTDRTAVRGGEPVELTRTQYAILELFARHPGQLLTREKILEEVWGYTRSSNTRTVDTHIWRLRQKLRDEPREVQWIQTVVAGDGYRMVSDPVT